jgi:hypothetical protein
MLEQICFFQEDNKAEYILKLIKDKGEHNAINFLKQWHYPGQHPVDEEVLHADKEYEHDGYVMVYNTYLRYVGLEYRV